ncbi:hypothetical protein BAE44_0000687 [Dichanthelium oligosanthes]|uniref:F-box domain-containing protein n=1 Tax=Dichanthelium oligosanthes TaxID=888268 RepID=A0A1E5WLS7_9POAL|nr:hypothetical protein BAE44_0000687 [Dichanthelium oligosanthes]
MPATGRQSRRARHRAQPHPQDVDKPEPGRVTVAGQTMPPPLGEARNCDRLSALPDALLHRVLRFLDAREAVAELSLLSRRWRHLWATTPYVALSDAAGATGGHSESFGGSLRGFSLDSRDGGHAAHQAGGCATPWATTSASVRLPLLKRLHLFFVKFGDDPSAVEKLNAGCPALEDLSLSQCGLGSFKISFDTVKTLSITDKYSEIHISAPNTCSLRLTVSSRVHLEFMPSLSSAWVYFCGNGAEHHAPCGCALLAALRNVQHLELLIFSLFLQFKGIMGNSSDELLTFGKLMKSLCLGEWLVYDFYKPFAYFLRRAPNLATPTLDEWEIIKLLHIYHLHAHALGSKNYVRACVSLAGSNSIGDCRPSSQTMSPRGDAAAGRDRLSALPDDLLHRILRHLDARQAARDLSRLSRRWRRVWASSPSFTLHQSAGAERFGNNLLLLRDPVDLRVFCLHSSNREHFFFQHRWLRYALSRGLCVLEINLSCRNCLFKLPDCVFSCATLEEFNLTATAAKNEIFAPRSVCLPCLKKLHLEFVRFEDPSVVEKLNSGCPALEDLSLYRCPLGSFKISSDTLKILSITDCEYDEIRVSAPNVCSLRLTVSGKVQLDSMPFLVSAWVYLCDKGVHNLAQGGYDLAAALSSAQHLELFRFNLFLQDIMESTAHQALSFCKLKTLYIGEWRVTDFYGPIAYFLQRAPSLVALTLDQWKLYQRHDGNTNLEAVEKKTKVELKLVSALTRDLETLLVRLSKGDDIGEFRKVRRLLKETTKPKETEIIWF